jgi:hypothetical protein
MRGTFSYGTLIPQIRLQMWYHKSQWVCSITCLVAHGIHMTGIMLQPYVIHPFSVGIYVPWSMKRELLLYPQIYNWTNFYYISILHHFLNRAQLSKPLCITLCHRAYWSFLCQLGTSTLPAFEIKHVIIGHLIENIS